MISFISSYHITSVVIPDPKIVFQIGASVADADAVTPNGIKALLPNGLSTFSLKVNQAYLKITLIVLFFPIEFLIVLH